MSLVLHVDSSVNDKLKENKRTRRRCGGDELEAFQMPPVKVTPCAEKLKYYVAQISDDREKSIRTIDVREFHP